MKTNKLIAAVIVCLPIFSCTHKYTPQPKAVIKAPTTDTSMSVYQLQSNWLTQDGKTITLSTLKGKVQVVAMVFTHCRFACPRIVSDMQNIENNLAQNIKEKVGFTLVSFDTERDSVARLKQFADEMSLDNSWILLHGEEGDVRMLSLLLDVNYEKLDNGDYNHTSIISVLDENGVVVLRHEGLDMDAIEMANRVTAFVK